MSEHESYEHPIVVPERASFNNVLEFFLGGEILGGFFDPVDENIGIYSFCTNIIGDLPDMWDVVFTMDHEFIHWLLYAFVCDWASTCFDNICRDAEDWISGE